MKLNETFLAKPIFEEISKEELPDGVLCRVKYPICDIGQKNANGRVYEDAVWDRVHEEKDLKDKLENRALFGHAEHPEQTQSNLEKTSHVIFEMWKENEQEWQKFDVLDTPMGRIVDCLLKSCRVGCSTRAEGDLEEAEDDDGNTFQRVIPESYSYVTTDFTADPSTLGSIPYDVKRNVVSEVRKLLENKETDGGEKEFGICLLKSMECDHTGGCKNCGCCEVLKERKVEKQDMKEKTVESLIKEGTIKAGDPVLLQYAQDDIKKAKVEKIEEAVVSLLVGIENSTAVNVNGDAAISISPEGLITILPTEALSELGRKEPKKDIVIPEPEVTEPVEEPPPVVDLGTADAIIIGDEVPERKAMGPEDTIEVGDTIEIRNLEDSETVVEASKVTEVGTMIGDVDTEFHKVKTESGGDKWYEAEAYTLVRLGEKVIPEAKKQPGAKVRHRGDVVFPAGSSKVTDDKDHFPINNANQARNALARANQYDTAPKWYKGSLDSLVKKVASAVKAKYPSIEVTKAAKKPGKDGKKENIGVGSTVKLTKEVLETYRRLHHEAYKEDFVRNIKFDENEITEGKVTKIEETGITIALDDGTMVAIEDPTAVNITVTKPAPAEEIEPVMPPEEEIDQMAAAGPPPIEKDIPEEEFESKTNEQKLSVDDVKKLFKSIDKMFAKHLTGLYGTKRQVALKGKEVGLELSTEGEEALKESKKTSEAKLPTRGGVSEEIASGNLLQDKEGKDWTVKEVRNNGLVVSQPGEPGTEKYIAWGDVDSYGFTKVSETKVNETAKSEVIELLKQGKVVYGVVEGTDVDGVVFTVGKIADLKEYEESGYWEMLDSYPTEEKAVVQAEKLANLAINAVSIGVTESKVEEDISRKEFLLRKIKKLKKAKEDFEKENQRKLAQVAKELKALEAGGSGLKKESKVEEATSVEKNGEWFVESPSGAILGGPYGSKIEADKRKKDVEFYAASKESKVDEEAEADKPTSLTIGETYSGDELDEKGYDIVHGEEGQVRLPERDYIVTPVFGYEGSSFVVRDEGNDNYKVVRKLKESKVEEAKSISTTAKEIKDLRVGEASTRAERDKAIELLEEITDNNEKLEEKVRKEKAFEIKILVNKIGKTLEAREQEVDAVRAKLEEKAKLAADMNKQFEEQKELVAKAQEQLNDMVSAAADRVTNLKESITVTEDRHHRDLLEVEKKHRKTLDTLAKVHETKIKETKEETEERVKNEVTKEFVKCFIEFKLSETALKVDGNSQALLEKCKSLGEVEEVLEEIIDAGRRSALHSASITAVQVPKSKIVDPEQAQAERQVKNALDGMNR